MSDLELDEDFDIVISGSNDLGIVSGNDELSQSLVIRLHLYQRNVVGDLNSENAIRKVRLETNRALAESDRVNSVDMVEISRRDSDSLEVYIVYNNGETINEVI